MPPDVPPEMPRKPERPPLPQPQRGEGSWLSTLLALGTGMLVVTTLVMLFAAALPMALPALAIGVLVFVIAALQYLLWGWWLGKAIRRDAEEEEEAERMQAEAGATWSGEDPARSHDDPWADEIQ